MTIEQKLHSSVLISFLSIALACGGGGGSPTAPGLAISFAPESNPSPVAGDVELQISAASTSQVLVLDLVVQGPLSDVFAVPFRLQFDPTIMSVLEAQEGTVLGKNGQDETIFLFNVTNNILFVGLTRKGQPQVVGGVTVSGKETLVTLVFQTQAAGDSALTFSANEIQDVSGADISNHPWLAGTVTVQ